MTFVKEKQRHLATAFPLLLWEKNITHTAIPIDTRMISESSFSWVSRIVQTLTCSSGCRWGGKKLLFSESCLGLQMEGLDQEEQHLCAAVNGFTFFFLNPLLREICDYIFFSAQVLECIAQIQTYPTSWENLEVIFLPSVWSRLRSKTGHPPTHSPTHLLRDKEMAL